MIIDTCMALWNRTSENVRVRVWNLMLSSMLFAMSLFLGLNVVIPHLEQWSATSAPVRPEKPAQEIGLISTTPTSPDNTRPRQSATAVVSPTSAPIITTPVPSSCSAPMTSQKKQRVASANSHVAPTEKAETTSNEPAYEATSTVDIPTPIAEIPTATVEKTLEDVLRTEVKKILDDKLNVSDTPPVEIELPLVSEEYEFEHWEEDPTPTPTPEVQNTDATATVKNPHPVAKQSHPCN